MLENFIMNQNQNQELEKRIHGEKLELLFRQSIRGIFVTFLVASIFVLIFYLVNSEFLLLVWLFVFAVLLLIRYFISHLFLRDACEKDQRFWLLIFSMGVGLTGLMWGMTTVIFFPNDAAYQVIISIILIAMITAGSLYLSPIPQVYMLYVTTAAIPFSISTFTLGMPYSIIGIVLIPFSYFLWLSAKSFADSLTTTLSLRIRNEMLAQNLSLAKAEVEKHSNAKSEFLSQMSHEFRTPLNAILGFAQLLKSGKAAEVEDYAQEILHAGDHLLALVNELLEISSIEKGKINLHLKSFQLGYLVYSVKELMTPLAHENELAIEVNGMDDWQKFDVVTDEKRFTQIMVNLVSNAIKYNKRAGQVNINIQLLEGYFQILVEDTGVGISTQDQHKIFTRYNKLVLDSDIPGTGLGLAIVKNLVEAMGGLINFSSIEGEGSKFWFRFPQDLQKYPNQC